MSERPRFPFALFILGACGAALFVALLLRHNFSAVTAAVGAAGFGVAAVVLFHTVPLFLDALAWKVLFPREHRPRLRSVFWMRWAGEAVNTLLPMAQVGGDVVRARLASIRGIPLPVAAASVLADITLSVFAQVLFTVSGVALLAWVTGRSGLIGPAVAGSVLALLAVVGFIAVQRLGIFRMLGALASRSGEWEALVRQGEALDREARELYGRRRALAASAAWTMSSWSVGACEVWIGLWALGLPASYAHAFILESVGQGIRAALFLIPGALGVQEGGYMVVGGLLGIPAESALALALIRRVRELAFGVPGLVMWQWAEGRRLWRGRPVAHGTP